MERKTNTNIIKYILLVVVILICAIAIYANIQSNQNPYTEDRKQIVNDRIGGSNPPEEKLQDAKKLYEEGKEYLKSRMFNESITSFMKLKLDYPKSEWTKRATILWGICLTERSLKNGDRRDLYQARDKLNEIIEIFDEKPYEYSDDFTHYLLSLARVSRLLDGANLEILNHLEEMLVYYNGYTKCQLYAEVGFIYYNMNKFQDALRYFENACGPLGNLSTLR